MTIDTPSSAGQLADDAFSSGFYCAESVVIAVAKSQGIENDLLPKIATAFCSGMARTCGTCGALTGAMMGISLALGRSASSLPVEPCYAATQSIIAEFEKEFGARDCHMLLGCDLGAPEGQAIFREQKLGTRCRTYTAKAAEMAVRILAHTKP